MTKVPDYYHLGEEEDFDPRLIDDESLTQTCPIEWNVIRYRNWQAAQSFATSFGMRYPVLWNILFLSSVLQGCK